MNDTMELSRAREKAREKYRLAQKNLEASQEDPVAFKLAAQEANESWLEFKRVDVLFSNCVILKKMGDLYGC